MTVRRASALLEIAGLPKRAGSGSPFSTTMISGPRTSSNFSFRRFVALIDGGHTPEPSRSPWTTRSSRVSTSVAGKGRRRIDAQEHSTAGASNVIVWKEWLSMLTVFDGSLYHSADWDLWIRLARRGPPACVSKPLVAYASIRAALPWIWRECSLRLTKSNGVMAPESIAAVSTGISRDLRSARVGVGARSGTAARRWAIAIM